MIFLKKISSLYEESFKFSGIEIKNIDTNAPTKCEIEKTENTEEGLKITVNAEDEESEIEKLIELKILVENLTINTRIVTDGASNLIQVRVNLRHL